MTYSYFNLRSTNAEALRSAVDALFSVEDSSGDERYDPTTTAKTSWNSDGRAAIWVGKLWYPQDEEELAPATDSEGKAYYHVNLALRDAVALPLSLAPFLVEPKNGPKVKWAGQT